MMRVIEYTDEFEAWWYELTADKQQALELEAEGTT
jgi:hypothetical protein